MQPIQYNELNSYLVVFNYSTYQYIIQYIIVVISKLLLAGKNVQLQLSRQLRPFVYLRGTN